MIQLGGKVFELAYENKNGWNFEAFRERYSDVLDRYDYIVGDWGYNQLRLKGFFREGNPKASKETCISTLQEYIQEYCNFGCAYFVLERIHGKKKLFDQQSDSGDQEADSHRQNRHNKRDASHQGHHQQHQNKGRNTKDDADAKGNSETQRVRDSKGGSGDHRGSKNHHRGEHHRKDRNKKNRNHHSKNA